MLQKNFWNGIDESEKLQNAINMYKIIVQHYLLLSLTPLLSNLAVSTTNTVNLVFNSTKMAEATN